MAGRDLGPRDGFYWQGRDINDVQETVDTYWKDFEGTSAGQDVIDMHRALNPDSDLTNEQIIKQWAEGMAPAFMWERRGSAALPTVIEEEASRSGVPQSLIEHTLREQPYSETARDPEKAKKAVIEGEKELSNLQSQLDNATKVRDVNQIKYLNQLISTKEQEIEPYKNILNRLEERSIMLRIKPHWILLQISLIAKYKTFL